MMYSYAQPKMNWKGGGTFKLSRDDQRLFGSGMGDPNGGAFTWEGIRKGEFVLPK